MPLNAIKYQNTVIYKIQHINKDELLYVGHTTDFTSRKYQHKHSCITKNGPSYNLKLYTMIRENGGWDCFKMLEIKKYPCNDHREASSEEDKIIKELKSTLNSRGSILNKQRKDELANSKEMCECGQLYTHKHKTRHQQSQRHITQLNKVIKKN